jgi:hypothetical protein
MCNSLTSLADTEMKNQPGTLGGDSDYDGGNFLDLVLISRQREIFQPTLKINAYEIIFSNVMKIV